MKKLYLILLVAVVSIAATVGWDNRNFIADTFQFTGGSVRTNFGPTVLSSNTTSVTNTNLNTPTPLMSYTIPANTLSTNGDAISVDASFQWNSDLGTPTVGLTVFGSGIWEYGSSNGFSMGAHMIITRVSSSTATVYFQPCGDTGEGTQSSLGQGAHFSGLNFASTNSFNYYGYSPGGGSSGDNVIQYFMNVYKVPAAN